MPVPAFGDTARPLTKIAIVLDEGLATWQKLNVTAFLASGIAATAGESIGQRYKDADGTEYAPMFGQPVMVFGADAPRVARTLNRAVDRGLSPAIFTSALFHTGHDDANRAAVAAVGRAEWTSSGWPCALIAKSSTRLSTD